MLQPQQATTMSTCNVGKVRMSGYTTTVVQGVLSLHAMQSTGK